MSTTKVTRNMLDTGIADSSNATAITIDSSENVSIGYASPNAKFTIGTASGQNIEFYPENTTDTNMFQNYDRTDSAYQKIETRAAEHIFSIGSSEKMRIDSSGNVGIGTTSPSSYLSNNLVVSAANDGGITIVSTNTSNGNYLSFADGTSGSDRVRGLVGYNHGTDFLFFQTNAAEVLRIDSSGRLLVGFSAAHSDTGSQSYYSKLIVKGNTYSSNTDGRIVMQNGVASTSMANDTGIGELIYTNGSGGDHAAIKAFGDGAGADNDYPGRLSFWTTADGAANPTERMRINNAGDVNINSSSLSGNMLSILVENSRTGNAILIQPESDATINAMVFKNSSNANSGFIQYTSSSTSYATSSDYRLKENVTDMTEATTRLKQLKPKRFNWIIDESNTPVDGFLAHEVSSIVPQAVTGTKDAVDDEGNPDYQGIDNSHLVPLLVKTIQELEARITTLEG